MQIVGASLLLLVFAATSARAGPYEDCILANMKGVQDRAAAVAIREACRTKTTPKKCRDGELATTYTFEDSGKKETVKIKPDHVFYDMIREECIAECAEAFYWSRKFGECSLD